MNQMENLLGNRIKEARKRADITQEALSKRLKIAYQTLNKYERGHRIPDAELLRQIAKELNCNPGWLLTGEDLMEHIGLVKEPLPIYNIGENSDLSEILKILQEHPEDKRLVLKLLKGKKDIKEALEGFEIKKLLKEEG